MKRTLLFAMIMVTGTILQAAPFTQGNLVVYRIGDGTSLLTNAGNYAFLDELTTNGVLVQSVPVPQNQFIDADGHLNFPIQNSGAATSEGLMTLSTDGRYLVFAGYGTNDGWKTSNGGVQLPTSTTVPRVIGRADWLGNVNTTTWSPNFINGSGGNPRGVASTDGSNFWITSSTEGVGYTTLGSNDFAVLQANNNRGIAIYDDRADIAYPGNVQIYFTSSTRLTSFGTNLPTKVTFNTNLVGISNTVLPFRSPYGFVALPLQAGNTKIDTIYLADEGSNVSKWCYSQVNSNWSNFGSIDTSAGANGIANPCGARSITASLSVSGNQTNVNLFVLSGCGVAGGGTVYAITDSSGYNGTLTGTWPAPIANTAVIFAAHPLVVWRGIAFAPANTLRVTSVAKSGNDVPITWNAVGGNSYVVQASPGDANGGYTASNFVDISPTNFVPSIGYSQTNYTDVGGATNSPSRYYRVRQVSQP